MADRVHPTAFGQIAIAERALAVLAGDGMTVRVTPSSLISYETTWRGRLRGDLSYAYRSAKQHRGAALARPARPARWRVRTARRAGSARAAAGRGAPRPG